MATDAGKVMKDRLRADLRDAMKARKPFEAKVIRALVASLDNAEAPAIHVGPSASLQHPFRSGSAELERLLLDEADVRRVLLMEVEEREQAAVELERVNMTERAKSLRAEAATAKRYLE